MKTLITFYILMMSLLIGCAQPDLKFSQTPQTNIIRDRDYKKLLIEVCSVDKITPRPTQEALDFLRERVKKYCHKEEVIIQVDDVSPVTSICSLVWNTGALSAQEQIQEKFHSTGDTLVVHILYLPGLSVIKPTTIGLAFGDYSIAIFSNIMSASSEKAVLLHEFGHLMGLVNCGSKLKNPHEDPSSEHKLHCKNKYCAMYWCPPPGSSPDFDDDCIEDLRANGAK